MAYGTVTGVAARLPGVRVSAISTPDDPQITTWLAQGAAAIDRRLNAAGYVVPVGLGADVYPELVALGELYAAAQVVRARGLDSVNGEAEARSDVWLREFYAQIDALAQSDLTGMGVAQATVAGVRVRGVRSVQLRRIDGYSAHATGESAE